MVSGTASPTFNPAGSWAFAASLPKARQIADCCACVSDKWWFAPDPEGSASTIDGHANATVSAITSLLRFIIPPRRRTQLFYGAAGFAQSRHCIRWVDTRPEDVFPDKRTARLFVDQCLGRARQ